MAGRQLSIREWCDAAYSLLVDSLRGRDEPLHKALDRANDMFLTPQELARKQNKEAFKKLGIPPPRAVGQRVTPLGGR